MKSRGVDPAEMLTDRGLAPDVRDGKVDFTRAKESLSDEYDELNEALDASLQRYKGLRVSDDEILAEIDKAIAGDPALQRSGRVERVREDARKLLEGYKEDRGGVYDVPDIQEFKKSQYQQSRKYNNPVAPNPEKADAHSVLGRAFKQIVAEKADDTAVKALNEEIGRLQSTQIFLDKVDGTAVRGGRLGKYFGQIIGAATGAQRGPIGALVGALGGDFTARLLQNNAVIGPLKRFYLARTRGGYTNAVLEATLKYLDDIEAGRAPAVPEAVRQQIIKDLQDRPLLLEAGNPDAPQSSNNVPIAIPTRLESEVEKAEKLRRESGGIRTDGQSFNSGAIPETTTQKIGDGEFGPIYTGAKGQDAVAFLLKERQGEVRGAFSRPEIGDIDLVWGTEGERGYGLAHFEHRQGVVNNLSDIIENGDIQRNGNTVTLSKPVEGAKGRAFVRLDWKGNEKRWIVTAYGVGALGVVNTQTRE